MNYTIAIRTDGSNSIGMGHISSSLALAKSLLQQMAWKKNLENSCCVYFIMKDFEEGIKKVKAFGFEVIEIDSNLNEEESIGATLKILHEKKTDVLITDLLEINYDFSDRLHELGIKSVSIDILGNTKLNSDLLFNRTIVKQRYKKYINLKRPELFLGSDYVILGEQFIGINEIDREINRDVKKIVVCFGGGDEFNITSKVVKIINKIPGISVTIILGSAFKGEEELNTILANTNKYNFSKLNINESDIQKPKNLGSFIVVKDVPNISHFFLECDLAICGGGSMLYEFAVTGTPALIIPLNDHQIENAEAFVEKRSVKSLPLHTKVSDNEIESAIKELIDNYELRKDMSLCGKKITDGKGASRIAKIIFDFVIK